MMFRVFCSVCVIVCCMHSFVQADEKEDVRSITIDGKEFVAFDRVSANFLLNLRIKYPNLILQLANQDELILLKNDRIILLEQNLVNLSKAL